MAAKVNLSRGDSQRYFIEDGSRPLIGRWWSALAMSLE